MSYNINTKTKGFIDIYSVSGIAPGSQITIQNCCDVNLNIFDSDPTSTSATFAILPPYEWITNDVGDTECWTYCNGVLPIRLYIKEVM